MANKRHRSPRSFELSERDTAFSLFPLWSPRAYVYALRNFADFEGSGHDYAQYVMGLCGEVESVLHSHGQPVAVPFEIDEYLAWLADRPELVDGPDTRTSFIMDSALEYALFIDSVQMLVTILQSELLAHYAVEMVAAPTDLMADEDADGVFDSSLTTSQGLFDELMNFLVEQAPDTVTIEYLAFVEVGESKSKLSGALDLYGGFDDGHLRFEIPEDGILLNDVLLVGAIHRCRLIITCYAHSSLGTKFKWTVERGNASGFVALPFS